MLFAPAAAATPFIASILLVVFVLVILHVVLILVLIFLTTAVIAARSAAASPAQMTRRTGGLALLLVAICVIVLPVITFIVIAPCPDVFLVGSPIVTASFLPAPFLLVVIILLAPFLNLFPPAPFVPVSLRRRLGMISTLILSTLVVSTLRLRNRRKVQYR